MSNNKNRWWKWYVLLKKLKMCRWINSVVVYAVREQRNVLQFDFQKSRIDFGPPKNRKKNCNQWLAFVYWYHIRWYSNRIFGVQIIFNVNGQCHCWYKHELTIMFVLWDDTWPDAWLLKNRQRCVTLYLLWWTRIWNHVSHL